MLLLLTLILSSVLTSTAYTSTVFSSHTKLRQVRCSYHNEGFQLKAKGKGFGKPKEQPEPVVKRRVEEQEPKVATNRIPEDASPELDAATLASMSDEDKILNTQMFKKKMTRDQEDLEDKIRRVREEEELISQDPSVGAVPEIVADRMLGRIIAFFGVPVFGGLAIFVGAFFYSKKYDMVAPPAVIAYATQVPFVVGLVGISYAILSTSWEPETKGSLLGVAEFKINLQRIKDGLSRTSEQANLKNEIEAETEKLSRKQRRLK
jgi:hypothetical protein